MATTVSNFVVNSTNGARRPRGRPRKYFKPEDLSVKKPVYNNDNVIPATAAAQQVDDDAASTKSAANNTNCEQKKKINQQQGHSSGTSNDNNRPSSNDADCSSSSGNEEEPSEDQDLSRIRKERKLYSDEWALGDDDDIEGGIAAVNIADKLESTKFQQNFTKEMRGEDFNMAYLQSNNFNNPVLFRDKAGLGMQVPSPTFTVKDVRICVGSRRIVDVMDVITQKNVQMTMKDFQKYYDDPYKDKLYNVISLEFSHTRLENYVKTPNIVRQIDWVDCVWPRCLKELQKEGTNSLSEMMYPKVQKYCLMSVKGCYTDFHIDFGGTSVWYHILKGKKVFWLIPPTERNIQLYEQWILSGKQNDIFFGDTVERCGRVHLNEGDTFFIPTGWIHAVYTVKDSLVFGGNFLHSFAIEKQLRIVEVEDTTRVPQKFRYPFFIQMLWFVLERYVHTLLGTSHLKIDNAPQDHPTPQTTKQEHIHLTQQELHGLKAIIKYLHTLPSNKKCVPYLIPGPILLVKDVRKLIEIHCHDNPEYAITGMPVLIPPADNPKKICKHDANGVRIKIPRASKGNANGPRRRRTRCKRCQACQQADCGECVFCLDMVKFGGPGRAKQTCIMRQCLQPMLPITAACVVCGLDGWGQQIVIPIQKVIKDTPSSLMECCICYEICHPACLAKQINNVNPIFNEDLPNSWECLKCCKAGKNVEYKPRHFRARNKFSGNPKMRRASFSSDGSSIRRVMEDSEQSDGDSSDSKSMYEHPYNPNMITPKKRKYEGSCDEHNSLIERDVDRSQDGNITIQDMPLELTDRKDIIVPIVSTSSVAATETVQTIDIIPYIKQEIKEEDVSCHSSSDNSNSSINGRSSPKDVNSNEYEVAINLTTTGGINSSAADGIARNNGNHDNNLISVNVESKKVPLKTQQHSTISQPPISNNSTNNNNNNSSINAGVNANASASTTAVATATAANKPLRRPIYPVRPAAPYCAGTSSSLSVIADNAVPAYMTKRALILVFQQLCPADLGKCFLVCRSWANAAVDSSLWRKVDVTGKQLTGNCLHGIVRRQPETLIMDWTQIAKRQLEWLISRMPQLKELSLQGCTWNGVSALRMCSCPPLISLDVSFVNGVNDMSLRDILLPPKDTRPGLIDTKSRLRNLKTLKLANCEVSDISIRYIVQNLPHLTTLDLSQCFRISDAGIAQLIAPPATTIGTLVSLDLSGCQLITDTTVDYLMRCTALKYLDLRHTPSISGDAVDKFVLARTDLTVIEEKLLVKICRPLVVVGATSSA